MKTVFVSMLIVGMLTGCGKGGKAEGEKATEEKPVEEKPACVMTKAEVDTIALKIKTDETKLQELQKAFFEQDADKRKIEDLTNSMKNSGPLMAMNAGMEDLVKSTEKNVFPDQLIALRQSLAFTVGIVIVVTGQSAEKNGENYVEAIKSQQKILEDYGYMKIIDCIMKNINQKAIKLDKVKHQKTLELYAMTVRLHEMLHDARGTLEQIGKNNEEIQQESEKIKPLVELEHKQ